MSILTSLLAAAVVSLNGEWKLDYWAQPTDGAVRDLPVPAGIEVKSVPASVPGNCELELVKQGILPDPMIGMNSRLLRAYEGTQWLYTKTFDFKRTPGAGRVELAFDGIDTFSDVFLNGEKIGSTDNMFIPHRFDVTKKVKDGANTVQVLIRSALYEAQSIEIGELGYHQGFADNEHIRKGAFMGGWDIFPRCYCAGLWRGARVVESDPVVIDDVAWMFGNFRKDFSACDVKAVFRVKGGIDAFGWDKRTRCTLSQRGEVKCANIRDYVAVHNKVGFWFEGPQLWWPRGMGEPALYDATIEIIDAHDNVIASDTRRVGIRYITLERDDVYGPERPGQFLFRVNGEPCYVRGSNWVPVDPFPARHTPERIRETLDMFVDLNCNMVRVWGGGVYEDDVLFDYCDEKGLMVWQDFMTGCSTFPQDDSFAEAVTKETREIVKLLRNHPSLVLWSGNNENDWAFRWTVHNEFGRDCTKDRNSRKTIPDVLYEWDVTRPYLPSSPYESPAVVSGAAQQSEQHLWGARAYYKVDEYTNSVCWFASEMGYHGCTSRESLERMMTKEGLYPWKGTPPKFVKDAGQDFVNGISELDWNDEWRLKASAPWMRASHLWIRNNLMTNQIRIMFGGVDTDLDTFIAQSQFIQAEAMKTFCELFRSRKFTRFNGLVWWNVRDGWPQISDAVVDWYGVKKPAYYALKNAQKDQIVCLVDDHSAWAVNDAMRPVDGKARFWDSESGKTLLETSFTIPANGKARLGTVPFEGQGVVKIEATLDGKPFKNHFLYGEPPFDWTSVQRWTK